jgi:glyoxylase-like metal-dependent hydrolase (beta-lactamase superfamily II)
VSGQPNLDWFDVQKFDDDVVAIAEPGHIEDVKAYLVLGSERTLLIDSCVGLENIKPVVELYATNPVILVNTHGHLDHIGNNWRFDARWVHPADADRVRAGVSNERLRRFLKPEAFSREPPPNLDPESYYTPSTEPSGTVDEGDVFDLGNRRLRVLHTPGHTPGCISLIDEESGSLFVGDKVHEGAMFAHYEGGWAHEYRASVKRLAELVPSINSVYPGHSRYPISPSRVLDVKRAFEEIWHGRTAEVHENGLLRFQFDPFSLTLRETWRDELPD